VRSSDDEPSGLAHDEESPSVAEATPDRCEQLAVHLKDSTAAMFMFASLNPVLGDFDVAAFRRYRDKLIADSGYPHDPIEVMLVEQLALAHLNTGLLFHRASAAGSVEVAAAYLAAVTRLMAEFRRTALALPAYREAVRRLDDREDRPSSSPEETGHDSGIEGGRRDDDPPGRIGARAGGDPRSA
jgi:hypothetical protein